MNRFLEIFNVVTLVVLTLCLVGAIQVLTNDLSYKEYLDAIWEIVAATAVGRGLAATGRVD